MHCNGCAERIGRVRERLPGVEIFTADHRQGKVEVRLDPGRSSLDEIKGRIEHLDYGVERERHPTERRSADG
jgi:copper chaperone CopZ